MPKDAQQLAKLLEYFLGYSTLSTQGHAALKRADNTPEALNGSQRTFVKMRKEALIALGR